MNVSEVYKKEQYIPIHPILTHSPIIFTREYDNIYNSKIRMYISFRTNLKRNLEYVYDYNPCEVDDPHLC